MKVSVSIPDGDVEFLDAYSRAHGFPSRSAALRRAIHLLRASDLSRHYEAAFSEWDDAGEGEVWDTAIADGLEQP